MATTQYSSASLMRLATYASVLTAVILITAKALSWWYSESVSMLATLTDSSMDLLASVITLFAVYHALQPADTEHRFGHGKAEALAGFCQACIVGLSAIFLFYSSVQRLFHPHPISDAIEASIWVMLLSIVVTGLLLLFQRYVVKKTGSTAISADALHYRTDFLLNIGVIVAISLTAMGWQYFDAIMAMVISMYILHSAWEILREAIDLLMDKELSSATRDEIKTLVMKHPFVIGVHDLRTRRAGVQVFIQMHIVMKGDLPLAQVSDVCTAIESDLLGHLENTEVMIYPHAENA
ncbi:cation diffusion facilitator family transporter [Methylophaga sp. OBS3]|nr:cation diffusion facilitator family transporter [Methylophaga sp. OBS3]